MLNSLLVPPEKLLAAMVSRADSCKETIAFNVFNRIKWQNWKPELVCGHFPTRHKHFWHLNTFPAFNKKKNQLFDASPFPVPGIVTSLASRQFNKFYTACMRDLIFEAPIFSWFADFSVTRRASIQVSEARKFLSLESVFFKFLFYVNAV